MLEYAVHRICPHCWHSLEAALRDDPALKRCPDCGGDIGAESATASPPAEAAVSAGDDAPAQESDVPTNGEAAAAEAFAPVDADEVETALEAIASGESAEADAAAIELPELEAPPAEAAAEAVAETAAAAAPSFTRNGAPAARPRASAWQWAALAALAMSLVLQLLLSDRDRLAADPDWRPLLSALCGALRCSLPAWREPQAFTMLSRDVRPAPDAPGTLLVQATFRNDARWPQAWPALQLSLSDADGRVLGARAFTAREYLGKSATQAPLAPGQSAQVSLRLREPSDAVVAFSFEFR